MSYTEQFLSACQKWCGEAGVTLSTLSTYACGSGGTLPGVMAGKPISSIRMDRALAWMRANPAKHWRQRRRLRHTTTTRTKQK